MLGSLVIDKDAVVKVADRVRAEDFYRESHEKIYEAITQLFERHDPIDILSLGNRLEEQGLLQRVGGRAYLVELSNMVPTSAHVVHYAEIVQKKATLRRLLQAASDITKIGYNEDEDVDLALDAAERSLFNVSEKFNKNTFVSIRSVLHDAFDRIDELHREKGKLRGVSTGFKELDNLLAFENVSTQSQTAVLVTMTDDQLKQRRDFAIQQNILTMRNRVNELGVAEPIIQRQGLDRIVVQLPGVQDPTQAERILGATATLEFRLVCENENAFEAEEKGRAPIGCELFNDRSENPVLLKKKAIVTGNQLIDASQSFSQGRPAVSIRLDSKGSKAMLETTKKNLNKPMAVLFVQQRQETSEQDGNFVNRTVLDKEVINIATIRGVFSSQFEITGLTVFEAKDLAILLRAGALAAPIFKIEEKTVGPSLGQDNIEKGFTAILYGLIAVIVFMIIWYKGFGLIANIGLLINLTFIVAVLSMLQASLTLPGIAGIVLTVGMAVDANVLIFERIREEINNGNSPQASISAGYQKAFATITDANVTTLIASLVLFTFGTGPIKGFAITLSIGILTSLFTAIIVSRALVNLIYGGKTIEKLRI